MLLINCPYCGPRAELEFHCGGEGGIVRPHDADTMDDAQWADYVFMRRNTRGRHHEQWCHDAGCGKWFNALRDTVTYEFIDTFPIGQDSSASERARETAKPGVPVRNESSEGGGT